MQIQSERKKNHAARNHGHRNIYIIAGEASGDRIGSNLMNEMNAQNPDSYFHGIGGEQMIHSGLAPLFPIEEISYMGFLDILLNIFKLKSLINKTIADIKSKNPDIVITIDSPGFCYRVVKSLRDDGYKGRIMHIVAPSVWAYKPSRAKKFALIYDHLLALLPFEPPFFEKEGLNTTYIGHPVFEQSFGEENNFRQRYDIKKDEQIILVTPGSRKGELKKHLPDFVNALNKLALTNSFIACFSLINHKELVEKYLTNASFKYIIVGNSDRLASYSAADIALAKSGTNTLEIAASKTPMIVAYKVDLLSYIVIKTLIKIKYASLINIIAGKEILPEFLQSNCNSDSLCKGMKGLLDNKKARDEQVTKAGKILKLMGYGSKEKPSAIAAQSVWKVINEN